MRTLSAQELDQVFGGWENEPPVHCNNGWGNGEDCAPGRSGEAQDKFEDPFTGPTPSNSPASGGGDR